MSYTIDEKNTHRQQLLAQCLDPLTIPILERLPRHGISRVLDLGCGQGNTTRMLARVFPSAHVTGLEYDPSLMEYARQQPGNERAQFVQGDVTSLVFPDGCFDLVFARYLLVHIPDLDKAISEIGRVLAPGGRIVSFEPDCCMDFTYPENAGMRTITRLFQQLFAQPHVGRQLVSRFRAANLNVLDAGALLGMEHKDQLYRRLYRATAEALGPAGEAKGVLAAEQFRELRSQMEALEVAPDHITVKLPDFWVIATR